MKYYTGLFALTQYADRNEQSKGMCSRTYEFYPKRDEYLRESNTSILKDYGIFKTIVVPFGDEIMCASHKRVLLDMLEQKQLDKFNDVYDEAVDDPAVMRDVLMIAYEVGLYEDKEVLKFLKDYYGSWIRSWLISIGDTKYINFLLEG